MFTKQKFRVSYFTQSEDWLLAVKPRPAPPQPAGLTRGALGAQQLPRALPLGARGALGGLPALALPGLGEAARVQAPRALPRAEQVAGPFALVNPQLARRVLDALPLLQKPTRCFALGSAPRFPEAPAAPPRRARRKASCPGPAPAPSPLSCSERG